MWVKVGFLTLILQVFGFSNGVNVSQVGTRIVGGRVVSINSLPYQVSIQFGTSHICGGALVAPYLVLSAAHCFTYSNMPQVYRIRVGSNLTSSGGQLAQVAKITLHKNYSSLTNDIAIAELSKNVTLSPSVQVINISTNDDYTAGSLAIVSGWGHTKENGTLSRYLQSVDIPLTTRSSCSLSYSGLATITKYMICAGYAGGGRDACQGDSGGPLAQNNKLIGLVSFGMGCARKYPGVYTNVARYVSWIKENSNLTAIDNGSTCDSIWCSIFSGSQVESLSSILLVSSVVGSFFVNAVFDKRSKVDVKFIVKHPVQKITDIVTDVL